MEKCKRNFLALALYRKAVRIALFKKKALGSYDYFWKALSKNPTSKLKAKMQSWQSRGKGFQQPDLADFLAPIVGEIVAELKHVFNQGMPYEVAFPRIQKWYNITPEDIKRNFMVPGSVANETLDFTPEKRPGIVPKIRAQLKGLTDLGQAKAKARELVTNSRIRSKEVFMNAINEARNIDDLLGKLFNLEMAYGGMRAEPKPIGSSKLASVVKFLDGMQVDRA